MYLNEGFLGREMMLQICRCRREVDSAGAGDEEDSIRVCRGGWGRRSVLEGGGLHG